MSGPLGRRVPTDWKHEERWPLTFSTTPSQPTPVTLGVSWYEAFDRPQRDSRRRWWVGRGQLGSVRGGHCVCIPPEGLDDAWAWRAFYDQGREGACVGYGSSRTMSLLNRRKYDARWLWNRAKEVDEWADTNPGDDNGTSVRAAMDVLRTRGHVRVGRDGKTKDPDPAEGIAANRWARSVDEVLAALQSPSYEMAGGVPFLNSWGTAYPARVWMTFETLARLLEEDGEAAIVTDR